jgi:hypothetical protein
MCSVRVSDLDELYSAIANAEIPKAATGIPHLTPISLQSWDQRVGFLIDPDGTQLHLIDDDGF